MTQDPETRAYVVQWEIDQEARSPVEAARQAGAAMRRPGSTANVFTVTGPDGEAVRVDLSEEPPAQYAEVVEMTAVLYWDKHDDVEVVAETPELAAQYVAGQWSDEYYKTRPVKVIRSLPDKRPLYNRSGRLTYEPDSEPNCDWDSIAMENGEFPGLGNGAGLSLDEVRSKMEENVGYGWDASAIGWNREAVEAAFEAHMAEAKAARAARVEAFRPYKQGTVVRTGGGTTLIRATGRYGTLGWLSSTSKWFYDAEIDPTTLTLVDPGVEED